VKKRIRALIAEMMSCLDQNEQILELSDKEVENLILKFPPNYCFGRCLPYLFSVPRNKFLYLGSQVENISGYTTKEWMADALTEFFPRIIQQEHLILICKATMSCFQVMRSQFNGSYDVQANMDFTLTRKNGQTCRVMMQFRPLIWDDEGYIVDIDHLKKHGLPVINLTSSGEVVYLYTPDKNDVAESGLTSFSPRELDILQMIAKGDDVSDITRKTGLSRATVYAHRRNIIAKSDFPNINKVIDSLRLKGVIS
jgi:DNA-binding CsgD family transcriptional regulator